MTTPTATDIEAIRARWAPPVHINDSDELEWAFATVLYDMGRVLAALDATTAERNAAQARMRELEGAGDELALFVEQSQAAGAYLPDVGTVRRMRDLLRGNPCP